MNYNTSLTVVSLACFILATILILNGAMFGWGWLIFIGVLFAGCIYKEC